MAPRGTYRQIADQLRRSIAHGELRPGDMVPSELALAEQHAVSRGTARSALAILVEEGLVEVLPGQGRRVVGGPRSTPLDTEWSRVAAALQVSRHVILDIDLRAFGGSALTGDL